MRSLRMIKFQNGNDGRSILTRCRVLRTRLESHIWHLSRKSRFAAKEHREHAHRLPPLSPGGDEVSVAGGYDSRDGKTVFIGAVDESFPSESTTHRQQMVRSSFLHRWRL